MVGPFTNKKVPLNELKKYTKILWITRKKPQNEMVSEFPKANSNLNKMKFQMKASLRRNYRN